jgi:hypothetical protein
MVYYSACIQLVVVHVYRAVSSRAASIEFGFTNEATKYKQSVAI